MVWGHGRVGRLVAVVVGLTSLLVGVAVPAGADPPRSGGDGTAGTIVHTETGEAFDAFRYWGRNRYETAALLARDAFADADTVLLARGDTFPDSLAGGYLAGQRDAALLLTRTASLPPETIAALDEIAPAEVVVLGGDRAIAPEVERELERRGHDVTRIRGADRYATAAAVATRPGLTVGLLDGRRTALLALGTNFPDALVISPLAYANAWPLLLTARHGLPTATRDALVDLAVEHVLVAGGTSAVDEAVERELAGMSITSERLKGATRTETALAVAEFGIARGGLAPDVVNLASGANFPDALSLAPVAGADPSPVLLARAADRLGSTLVADHLATLACPRLLRVAGGNAAVGPSLDAEVRDLLAVRNGCGAADPATCEEDPPVASLRAPGPLSPCSRLTIPALPGERVSMTASLVGPLDVGDDVTLRLDAGPRALGSASRRGDGVHVSTLVPPVAAPVVATVEGDPTVPAHVMTARMHGPTCPTDDGFEVLPVFPVPAIGGLVGVLCGDDVDQFSVVARGGQTVAATVLADAGARVTLRLRGPSGTRVEVGPTGRHAVVRQVAPGDAEHAWTVEVGGDDGTSYVLLVEAVDPGDELAHELRVAQLLVDRATHDDGGATVGAVDALAGEVATARAVAATGPAPGDAAAAAARLRTAVAAFADGPAIDHGADVAAIRGDVAAVPLAPDACPGVLGAIAPAAFPVAGVDGAAIVVAARHGTGRVVVMGHPDLDDGLADTRGSTEGARFVEGTLRWLTAGNPDGLAAATEAAPMAMGLANPFAATPDGSWPITATRAGTLAELGTLTPERFGVVVADRELSADERAVLAAYVAAGGGLLVPHLVWSLADPAVAGIHPLLADMGIAMSSDAACPGGDVPVLAADADRARHDTRRAYDALAAIEAGSAPADVGFDSVDAALAPVRGGRVLAHVPLGAPLVGRLAVPVTHPVDAATAPFSWAAAGAVAPKVDLHGGWPADPSAATFPGVVTGATPTTRTVDVDFDFDGGLGHPTTRNLPWHSTGLWANAGEPITLDVADVPGASPDRAIRVRIGAHTDDLSARRVRRRPPIVSLATLLDVPGTTTVVSPYGGLVYLEPLVADDGPPVSVTIDGAHAAPRFVLGETTPEQWRAVRDAPGPWTEFESDGVVTTFRSALVRDLDDPTATMQDWQAFVDDAHALVGLDDSTPAHAVPDVPHRYVADVQISVGYLHAGFPIMGPIDDRYESSLAGVGATTVRNFWGLWHELGHNVQQAEWQPPDSGEVTVNVVSLRAEDTWGQPNRLVERGHYDAAISQRDGGAGWLDLGLFERLVPFDQLRHEYGWALYTELWRQTRELAAGEGPGHDQQARNDYLVERTSHIAGANLADFWEEWGVPASAAARQRLLLALLPAARPDLPDRRPP